MVGTFSPSAHFIRSAAEIFHGLALRSMPRKAAWSCCGKAFSLSTSARRISRMSRIGSLPTGQISTQAPQAVHAHTASLGMANSISVWVLASPLAIRAPSKFRK